MKIITFAEFQYKKGEKELERARSACRREPPPKRTLEDYAKNFDAQRAANAVLRNMLENSHINSIRDAQKIAKTLEEEFDQPPPAA